MIFSDKTSSELQKQIDALQIYRVEVLVNGEWIGISGNIHYDTDPSQPAIFADHQGRIYMVSGHSIGGMRLTLKDGQILPPSLRSDKLA